jgi:hypothetical protein
MMIAAKKVKQQFDRALSQEDSARSPKFEKYTTPGGKNYREILLQLDEPGELTANKNAQGIVNTALFRRGYDRLDGDQADVLSRGGPNALAMLEDLQARLGIDIDVDEVLKSTRPAYHTGHFDDPNILVHARVTDRTGPNGEKVLYVEEIQSDWHQAGRNKGYREDDLKNKLAALTDERAKVFNQYKNMPASEETDVFELAQLKTRLGEIDNEYAALQKVYEYGVPDAPFKKTSHELALKQILDIAAKEGYDQVAIAPGSEQIKRYNMSNELDSLRALRDDQGKITLAGIKNDRVVIEKLGIDPEDLPGYIGKEKSDQILAGMGEDNIFELKGDDLQMTSKEGQGKKKIYDEILPGYLGKYAKKEFGSEPGEIDIFSNQGKSYEQYLDEIVEDPYRYIDEDEYFETIHERVTNRAAEQGYDLDDPDKWDELLSRDTNEADDIWAAVENDFYEEKAKELAGQDKGASVRAFSVPVTPQMREKITGEGQKLFAAAPVVGVQAIPGMEEAPQQAAPEPEPEVEETPMPLNDGGRVGKAKQAIEAAMKKAGQKKGQVADKDLTTIQDFQTSLGDRINEKVREKMKLMESFDYSYKPGDRVFTEWSAGNNYAPFEILSKTTTQKRFARDPNTSKILRDADGNKVEIQPEAGYLVRHQLNFDGEDIDHQYVIPEKNIKGLVEPDEPYKRGGPVGFQSGGMATPRSELEDDPFVRTVMNAARHYQAGKEIEAGQLGLAKGPVTVGVNAANIIDPGTRDAMQAQSLFAAYRDRLGGVDVNASVNKPIQVPEGFYQGNVMASVPVGPGRAMAGLSGYKSPQKTDISGYNVGYGQKVGPGYASGSVFQPKDRRQDTRYDVQYTIPFQSGGAVGFENGGRVGKTRAAAEKLLRVLHGSPTRITPESGKAIDVTTEPSYAVKRGADKMIGKSGPPMVNQFDIPQGRMLQFEEQYSPEDVALMRRYFNKLPQGQAMRGEEIFDAAQGRDVILEGIAKAGGFAGYERPNTGAVGKGQWFRVTEPEELVRKARGGLAQLSKPL